jgi:multiple sugar transport system permease protein
MASRGHSAARGVSRISFYLLLAVIGLVSLLPFLYMIANSLKTLGETITRVSANPFSPQFWPSRPQWSNFPEVLRDENMGHYFLNSVVISCISVAGLLATSALAAYAFSKVRFAGKQVIFSILVATLMVPETVLLIPNFLIIVKLGWINKLPALTVPFMAGAFYIFLLRQFFNQVPSALIESARLEGAGHLGILMRIVIPLSSAPMFTVAFLAFSDSWNGLQWALVVTQTDRWRPITVGLAKFISEAGPQTQLRMAGAIIALLPAVVVFIAAQRQITDAISRTGLKA